MRIFKGLAVATALALLLVGFTVQPAQGCDDGSCPGQCGDDCKCKGKCDGKCDGKCKGDCDGKCGDGCKGKGGSEKSEIRYSDPVFFGFKVQSLANGLPVVTWIDEEGIGKDFGFRKGDILLSANGKEIRELGLVLKALDGRKKAPVAVRVVRAGRLVRLAGEKAKCDGKCGGDCKGKCDGKCGGKCDGDCKGKCDGKCGDDCKGKCDGKCGDDCKGKCGGKCDGKCDGDCGDGCKGKCGGKCDGKCKGDCKGKSQAGLAVSLGVLPAVFDEGTAKVKAVEAGKVGSKMGLKVGDVILSVNGVDVTQKNGLSSIIVAGDGKKPVSLLILRGRRVFRMCTGGCGNGHCDGCKGRCREKCGGCGGGGCGARR